MRATLLPTLLAAGLACTLTLLATVAQTADLQDPERGRQQLRVGSPGKGDNQPPPVSRFQDDRNLTASAPIGLLAGPTLLATATPAAVNFNRDVRPILSEHCFPCHGPDAAGRRAGLRLDLREAALQPAESEAVPIVPGDPAGSELIERITAANESDLMPPPKFQKKLSAAQIDTLRKWIAGGAAYQKHWAFEPMVSPPLEKPTQGTAGENPIDTLVTANLKRQGLNLSPEATPETLLRRVTLDLTGLPPTFHEIEAFQTECQQAPNDFEACYERAVDRLLQSKHFGEHLAVGWLDAARYADTNGYFGDKPRLMWLWRDWVINAFNANMPFDQFTIEQLAGDLLPDATLSQRIATGFNRNHIANNETGIIDEEFRTEYVVDRVDTTMTTWMGLTAGCAQCHDHKFDPISQREFYQLYAFFNNVPESGLITKDNPPPLIEVPSPEQQQRLGELSAASSAAAKAFAPLQAALVPQITAWEAQASTTLPSPPQEHVVFQEGFDGQLSGGAQSQGTTVMFETGIREQAAKFDATQHVETQLPDFNVDAPWSIGLWVNVNAALSCPLSLIEADGNRRGIEIICQKGRLQINLVHRWGVSAIELFTIAAMSNNAWHHVVVAYDGSRKASGLQVFVDGVPAAFETRRDTLDGSLKNAEPLRIGRRDSGLGYYGLIDEVRLVQQCLEKQTVNNWFWGERIRGIVAVAPAKRSAQQTDVLLDYYVDRFADVPRREARQQVKATVKAEAELRAAIPTALVMQEMDKPRTAHVLERGLYTNPGEAVSPDIPATIARWPEGAPRNRLGFAHWLVSVDNPLTARVAVNRLWQHCFGEGLVRTVNDFGSQGEPPTHPELLDWLAVTFRDSGWNVKALLKRIVMSQTYRQSSQFTISDSQIRDPENRLLARGPSFRLSAEMLRDQALTVSGLLVRRIGGPSVKPYQPPGLWEAVSFNGEDSYVPDTGEGLWRRSLYTYVKRQAPPPALLTFDGPTREKCTVRRARTNTPLQALVLLNDQTYVAAARTLAAQTLKQPGDSESRLRHLWHRVLGRPANVEEVTILSGLLQRQRDRFAKAPEAAQQLISEAEPNAAVSDDAQLEVREHAAWTVLAQTVLNLDEAITKR
ncbi:MAG: DUF1553 domain-containing protein [Planctomycetota bacterium]